MCCGCPCRGPLWCPPMRRQDGIGDKAPTLCCCTAALLRHCRACTDPCSQTHPFGQAHVSWVLADLDGNYDSLCHLHAVHNFLVYSASPPITMITFSSSRLFFSSSSPRSDPSFVVDFSFLPPNSLGMTVTGSSSWSRNVGDFFYNTLGKAFLWNHTLQCPSEFAELAQQHSAQQCVRNLIRARDTVLVTSD